MATIFMAKSGEKPIGFYSTYELAVSVSAIVVELDVPVLDGIPNGCIFYADAVYSLFSMNNGIPKETNVTIGPYISRSANVALNDLHAEVARRRLSGCELDHFLCFELDRVYGETLIEDPMLYNDPSAPHFTCPDDSKNDPLIQKTWHMLLEGETWDLDHLTFTQLIDELSKYKPVIDFSNRFNSFTTNLVIRTLLEMCVNNASANVLCSINRTGALERVSINKVGYLVFMDDTAVDEACKESAFQPPIEKRMIQSWKIRDLFECFIKDEEYGIYFVQSLAEGRYLFVDRMLILSAYRLFLELRCHNIKDDSFESSFSDEDKELLNAPQWTMTWRGFFMDLKRPLEKN